MVSRVPVSDTSQSQSRAQGQGDNGWSPNGDNNERHAHEQMSRWAHVKEIKGGEGARARQRLEDRSRTRKSTGNTRGPKLPNRPPPNQRLQVPHTKCVFDFGNPIHPERVGGHRRLFVGGFSTMWWWPLLTDLFTWRAIATGSGSVRHLIKI